MRNVWWPLFGHLEGLHPEYEVMDWRGRSYYADYAFLPEPRVVNLLLEIKGFTSHVKEMDRFKFCYELNRETFLQAMGYQVVSLAYDDVAQRPDLCIMLLRMVISRYEPRGVPVNRVELVEREILRLTVHLAGYIRPKDVEDHLLMNKRTAISVLHRLTHKGLLIPCYTGQGERVRQYALVGNVTDYLNKL